MRTTLARRLFSNRSWFTAVQQHNATGGLPKVVVLGGNGFVGQRVLRSTIMIHVANAVAVNPVTPNPTLMGGGLGCGLTWTSHVKTVTADVFDSDKWVKELEGAMGVVSCMEAWDANKHVALQVAKAGVEHFVLVSTSPQYFRGKRRRASQQQQEEEAVVMEKFPNTGVILRPGLIYSRYIVGRLLLPLFHLAPLDGFLMPPVRVTEIGSVAAGAALGKVPPGVLTATDISQWSEVFGVTEELF